MSVIKLIAEADPIAFTALDIQDSESNHPKSKGKAQWRFIGHTATDPNAEFFMFAESAERQCKRMGVTRESIIGTPLLLSRTKDNYINVVRGFPLSAVAASGAPATPLTAEEKKAVVTAQKGLLVRSLDYAYADLLPAFCAEHGLDITDMTLEQHLQIAATLGAALYQGLSARGIAS